MKNSVMVNGKKYSCRIYDNGGETADRYTACFRAQRTSDGTKYYPYIGFGESPFHPQGIGYHSDSQEKIDGKHLGKRISFDSLNDDCKKMILQEFN